MSMSTTTLTMPPAAATAPRTTRRFRLGVSYAMTGLVGLFLLVDGAMKLVMPTPVVEASKKLGYPPESMFGIGVLLLASVALFLIPRTAVLGAILLTGYLGGAIATHVRVSDPLFTHTLFPIYFAAFIWGSLYLRDGRVRALLAPRRSRID